MPAAMCAAAAQWRLSRQGREGLVAYNVGVVTKSPMHNVTRLVDEWPSRCVLPASAARAPLISRLFSAFRCTASLT